MCEFCDLYNEINSVLIKHEQDNPDLREELGITLVNRTYNTNNNRLRASMSFSYMQFAYCPQCGKKLVKEK